MQLMRINEFRRRAYSPDSAPSPPRIYTMIQEGQLPGGFRDELGRYWIDFERFSRAVNRQIELNTGGVDRPMGKTMAKAEKIIDELEGELSPAELRRLGLR